MLFMTSNKKGLSACELQRQIGHMTIYYASVEKSHGQREAWYQLIDLVEFDDGYFEKEVPQQTKSNQSEGVAVNVKLM